MCVHIILRFSDNKVQNCKNKLNYLGKLIDY